MQEETGKKKELNLGSIVKALANSGIAELQKESEKERENKRQSGRIRSQWLGHVPVTLLIWRKVGAVPHLTQSLAVGPPISECLH